jgi:folate-binding protein YgfZ
MQKNTYIKNNSSKFIEVKGEDSHDFLQGLITNDINKCNNNIVYSCLLSPQGRFIADFFIIKIYNSYLIEIHEKYYDTFYNKLKIYKLRSNIEISKNNNFLSYVIFDKISLKHNDIILFDDPRNDNIGKKIYIEDKKLKNFDIFKNRKEISLDSYKEILMKNIIPYTPIDLIVNKSLLLENNFQNTNSIDWKKGCYVGQEITARMKYRSLLKKKIYVLEVMSGNLNPKDVLIYKSINIGIAISKIGKYTLCMLKINIIKNLSADKNVIKLESSVVLKFL